MVLLERRKKKAELKYNNDKRRRNVRTIMNSKWHACSFLFFPSHGIVLPNYFMTESRLTLSSVRGLCKIPLRMGKGRGEEVLRARSESSLKVERRRGALLVCFFCRVT